MKKINSSTSTLSIGLTPSATDKGYAILCDATSITLNSSYKQEDKVYWCNSGEQTSQIVGRALTISVSLDYDGSNNAHKYLMGLIYGDAIAANDQWIKLESLLHGDDSKTVLEGKACFNFTTLPPSGVADEISKLEFDILPQDSSFVRTIAKTKNDK